MDCPRCGVVNPGGDPACAACGIVFAKWRARAATPTAAATGTGTPLHLPGVSGRQVRVAGLPPEAWKAAAIGLPFALILPRFFPLANFLLSPLLTLVHELGHTTFNWLFGYPAVPAFDFSGGGGVTSADLQRSWLILAAWVAGLGYLAWSSQGRWRWLAVAGLALYGLAIRVELDERLIVAGGHLFEVLFGAVFLYRGLTGWGCRAPGERPLSCFLGFWILFHVVGFGWSLAHDKVEKALYLQGKSGLEHDLVTLANYTWWRLESLALALATLSVLVIPATFLAAAWHRQALTILGHDQDEE